MSDTANYGTLILRPHYLQWAIDKCPWIVINIIGYCLYVDTPLHGFFLILMVAMSLHLIYMLVYQTMMKFTVTGEMIIYEYGVFCRKREYIELYRVVDFREDISFLQNIFELKTVTVLSGDRTTPTLKIPGISLSYPLVPELRKRVEFNKLRKGIYEITNR